LSDHLRWKHNTTATKTIALQQKSIVLPGLLCVGDPADARERSLVNIAVDHRESTKQCRTEELASILDGFKNYNEIDECWT